ncbi:hypothetical protein PV10_07120 [Exophiala mesophila]|uniref:Uncharacterized protein n=1 Tax=Exophiala mesophila TaxID=212818 RepID=A0A0D1WL58_EXOME|nr:uncharacterized protein PV10_07120 [Exophiala mesophila]KIV89740.1 hypothetical protein PV10_07120 [Exophiala mesophila]
MQLDSHRCQPSFAEMHFPLFRRCGALPTATSTPHDALPATDPNGPVEDWQTVRRFHFRMMRKQVRSVIFMMALMEALRHGPLQLAYSGKHGYPQPGPEDFGIAYNVGYFLSWLYVCLFMIVYVPLFSWWVPKSEPSDSTDPSATDKLAHVLKVINMYLIPFTIGIALVQHLFYIVSCFIYVDSRAKKSCAFPPNTRKNWIVRGLFLLGIAISTISGYFIFKMLAAQDLAHVKDIEYYIIVVPFQINFGIFLGTIMQFRMEKIAARRAAKAARAEFNASYSEKQRLLDV